MNDEIGNCLREKMVLFQNQRKSGNLDFFILNLLTQDILNAITSSKLKYELLTNKLNNPKTAPKTYLKKLKTFVNGPKIPMMPPLLAGNQLATDFLVKGMYDKSDVRQ